MWEKPILKNNVWEIKFGNTFLETTFVTHMKYIYNTLFTSWIRPKAVGRLAKYRLAE